MNAWEQAPLAKQNAWESAPLLEEENSKLSKLGMKPELVASLGGTQAALKAVGEQEINPADDVGRAEAAAISYGRGVLDLYQGMKQMYLQKFGDEGAAARYTRDVMNELAQYEKLQDKYPITTGGSRIAGTIGSVPVPGPGGIVGKGIAGTAKAAAKGAAASGAVAGTMFVQEGQSRGLNAAIGAAGGAVAGPMIDAVGKVGGRALNAAKGRISPAAAKLMEEAKARGIRLSGSDVIGDSTWLGKTIRDAELLSENIPFGMFSFRQKQQQSFKSAMRKLTSDAKRFLGTDDPGEAVQTGLIKQLNRYRARANELFGKVADLSDEAAEKLPPNAFIATKNMNKVAEAYSKVHESVGDPALQSKLAPFMKTLSANPRAKSFRALQEVRDSIKAKIDDYHAGNTTDISKKGISELIDVKTALEKDMESYARAAGGKLWQAYQKAQEFYKGTVAKYKNDKLLSKVAGSEVDFVVPKWLQTGKADRVQRLYEFGTPEVQRAMRASIIDEIAQKASVDGSDIVSPAKFTSWFDKHRKSIAVAFKGDQELKAQFEGLNRVARAVKRAGQVAESPPTGNRLIQGAAAAGVVGGVTGAVPGAAGVVGATSALTFLLRSMNNSTYTQKFLMAASRYRPDSKAMERLLKELQTRMAAAPGAAAPELAQL